ncbi:DUF5995 family protein [Cyclobacterium amurskyense]|jgi:hypothetical protein|uniref:Uncharacterized protein n=1 Tax=Cyclobacterium amurskyense TaxID=320787 RepID=A0A0H4PUP7_9BACT|nr:DUF5995 family protein [Cyclobacterium amurskyense]AKP52057.1 hypothetical protein CA2015_2647 [Cyclobacterium amurskyense]|tara:strand:- start:2036 stop:2791 length:756 start_codon:yes stop_codon:yes gene_type:complete
MPDTTTIQDVIKELDVIIDESIKTNSRLGLFAYIYRRTTFEIASEIALGHFENNARLETLDVAFAKLYLDAYSAYKKGETISASWAYAFDHVGDSLTIVQHIMLGMNAHINLDLAVATAATMSGGEIRDIENDFNKVNDILFQITNELQDRLNRVSPLMIILDIIGKNKDEKIINFSMRKARKHSWNSAKLLWSLGEAHSGNTRNKIDYFVLKLSEHIQSPKSIGIRILLKFIQKFETKEVSAVISELKAD